MNSCVIFGGAGYIGTNLARHLLSTGQCEHVHIADIQPSPLVGATGVSCSLTDVRQRIPVKLAEHRPDWIFNLAAVHREPGHRHEEYYDTNILGARNVCEYAEVVGCNNIYFTSSISVYGPTPVPTSERAALRPATAYGGSKLAAELIHEVWLSAGSDRRLVVSRPGVIYGPGDPGNILRMIRAIRRGYFAFPGSTDLYKSYGYIYGLLDSIDFCLGRGERQLTYNYVEHPTERLIDVVNAVKTQLQSKALVLAVPKWLLMPAAQLIQKLFGANNPIHPVRVRKAATPTHIVPQFLIDSGFGFRFDFENSLRHWLQIKPADFGVAPEKSERHGSITLRRPGESRERDQLAPLAASHRKKDRIAV